MNVLLTETNKRDRGNTGLGERTDPRRIRYLSCDLDPDHLENLVVTSSLSKDTSAIKFHEDRISSLTANRKTDLTQVLECASLS